MVDVDDWVVVLIYVHVCEGGWRSEIKKGNEVRKKKMEGKAP